MYRTKCVEFLSRPPSYTVDVFMQEKYSAGISIYNIQAIHRIQKL